MATASRTRRDWESGRASMRSLRPPLVSLPAIACLGFLVPDTQPTRTLLLRQFASPAAGKTSMMAGRARPNDSWEEQGEREVVARPPSFAIKPVAGEELYN